MVEGLDVPRWVRELEEVSKYAQLTNPSAPPELGAPSISPVFKQKSLASLDTKPQISTWDKKHKRVYSCALTGIQYAFMRSKKVFFLTLTTSPQCTSDIGHDWDLLVKRVRRELNYDFQYMKVETSEGYGVIHALFHSAFDGWAYDAIHAYFSCLWKELHKSPIVWCSVVDETRYWSKKRQKWIYMTRKKVAGYIVQYAVNQKGFLRRAQSFRWIFRGWRKKFVDYIVKHGLRLGLSAWRFYLSNLATTYISNISLLST